MQPVRRVRSIAAATGSIGRILIDRAAAQGEAEPFDLSPAHSGIASGRFVVRDGDVYGHTVNLAARIAAHGVAGEMLITAAAAESLTGTGLILEDAGQVVLKGIPEPVGLVRILP